MMDQIGSQYLVHNMKKEKLWTSNLCLVPPKLALPADDAVICERCGAEMFRMHAVWRCPACGYKTDCCGW
jgi:rubrerythrin